MPKVGDKVYRLGYRGGPGPCVVSEEIIGETVRSWLFPPEYRPTKIPKKGFPPEGSFLTEADAERFLVEQAWIRLHGQKICEMVCPRYGQTELSYETLRKVAEIVGYKEKE